VSGSGFSASIFDMDGLLIDSEPLWQVAEVEILGHLGVPIEQFPWDGPGTQAVAEAVVDRVCELVVDRANLLPGVHRAIAECRAQGLAVGLASSSQYRLIETVLGHFGLTDAFDVIHSAEEERYGKPHPAVYLGAANKLKVDPTRCVAWEDAGAGVLAAKAARMVCVAVPEPAERRQPAFAIADAVLGSLEEVDAELFARLVLARRITPPPSPPPLPS
jgi:sugar-phosphatase